MYRKKLILTSVLANVLVGCSSPPVLPEPKGQWVDFESPRPRNQTVSPVTPRVSTKMPAAATPAAVTPAQTAPAIAAPVMPSAVVPAPTSPVTPSGKTRSPDRLLFVSQDGRNKPLRQALRDIVPSGWNIELSRSVSEKFTQRVSWKGNDQWPYVLEKMLRSYPLDVEYNDDEKRVFVDYRLISPPPVRAAPALSENQPADKTATPPLPVATITASPSTETNADKTVPQAAKKTGVSAEPFTDAKTTPKPAPVMNWQIDKGTLLKEGLAQWAAKERCHAGTWSLMWETEVNYSVDAPLTFSGDFKKALNDLFTRYKSAERPLYASTSTPQCLIRVSDKPFNY